MRSLCWCTLHGQRDLVFGELRGDGFAIKRMRASHDRITGQTVNGASVCWRNHAAMLDAATAETLRRYLAQICSPCTVSLDPSYENATFDVSNNDAVTTITARDKDGKAMGSASLHTGPYRRRGGGFVFCTDDG